MCYQLNTLKYPEIKIPIMQNNPLFTKNYMLYYWIIVRVFLLLLMYSCMQCTVMVVELIVLGSLTLHKGAYVLDEKFNLEIN